MNRNLYRKAADTVKKYNMFTDCGRIIVGVSGGADSMALLHFLISFIEDKKRIVVCHVNHGIRGEEAQRDEKFVENFCDENDVVFRSISVDIPALSKEKGLNLEECARLVRYSYFSSFVFSDNDRIVTAHTLSDLAETMVFRFITGTSVHGLSGILPVRDKIVRPFINITREEVEEYCEENGISFVTDSTNLSDEYTRNFIRHQIIPKMKEINHSFTKNWFLHIMNEE